VLGVGWVKRRAVAISFVLARLSLGNATENWKGGTWLLDAEFMDGTITPASCTEFLGLRHDCH